MDREKYINKLNIEATLRRHGVANMEEYQDKLITNPTEWRKIDNELLAERWINENMRARGKTVLEYIRAVVECKIID